MNLGTVGVRILKVNKLMGICVLVNEAVAKGKKKKKDLELPGDRY